MLVDYLRRKIHLTGTKVGCNAGGCGACTVMLTEPSGRHRPVLSCLMPLALAHNCHVTTIEGVAHGAEGCGENVSPGELHPIQRQFADGHASQCGFCTPVSEHNAPVAHQHANLLHVVRAQRQHTLPTLNAAYFNAGPDHVVIHVVVSSARRRNRRRD